MALLRQVIAAAAPFADVTGPRTKERQADLFEALRPIFGNYVVADAFLTWRMLKAAFGAELHLSAEGDALYESIWLLETFVAFGFPSGPSCVSARAGALSDDGGGEAHMGDANHAQARQFLASDIGRLRSGDFRHGELFDSKERFTDERVPPWLWRSLQGGA